MSDDQDHLCDPQDLRDNIDGLHVAIDQVAEDREHAWETVEVQSGIISALIAVIEADGSEVVIQGLDEFAYEGKLH